MLKLVMHKTFAKIIKIWSQKLSAREKAYAEEANLFLVMSFLLSAKKRIFFHFITILTNGIRGEDMN